MNKFETAKYLDQVKILNIGGGEIKYIQIFSLKRLLQLKNKTVEELIAKLKALSFTETYYGLQGSAFKGSICDTNPDLISAYKRIIDVYGMEHKCTREEAYKHFNGMYYCDLVFKLEFQFDHYHRFFYYDGSQVNSVDNKYAAKKGILLLDNYSLNHLSTFCMIKKHPNINIFFN